MSVQIICYTISSTLDYVGLCENATSILWVRRFFQGDEFQIRIPATKNNIKMFAKGNAVELLTDQPTDKSYFCGVITDISMSHTAKGEEIVVKGMSPDGFLSKRIMSVYTDSDSFMTILDKNAGEKAESARRFPAVIFETIVDAKGTLAETMVNKRLSDYVRQVGLNYNIGLISHLDHDAKKFVIMSKLGVDRSVSQSKVKPVVFSNEYENVSEFSYDYTDNGAVNAVYVYSDEQKNNYSRQDVEAFKKWYTNNGNGFERFEKAAKIQPVKKTELRIIDESAGVTEDWQVLDEAKTQNFALEKSKSQYAPATEFFNCNILLDSGYHNIADIGDIITLQNTNWNVTVNKQITEIPHLYNSNGAKITATLGDSFKTTFEIFTNRQGE